ncbi:MAG TPA: hypothetical protein PLA94_18685 [Myxococcota bacterium]|nr:hypothetical protein [Myxococcota bacterium]
MTLILALLACTGSKDSDSTATTDDSSTTTDDSSADDSSSTDDSGGGTASLLGNVTTALENSQGDLYFGIFDGDPTTGDPFTSVADAQYPAVDVNAAAVPYRIDNLPTNKELFVIAFLDLDANVSETGGPDGGDYLAMSGNTAFSVTLQSGERTLDLVLNTVRPDTPPQ